MRKLFSVIKSEVRVYSPNSQAGWGLYVWREMLDEIIHSRELTWRLFLRDFSARYRQSIFGVLWVLILPLITVITFVFLNRSGIINVSNISVPYPVFVLIGLTIWQVFASGLIMYSNAIVLGGSMIVKINFPKETLVIAAMGQVLVELVVRLILLAIVMVMFQVNPKWTVIFFPFTLLPLLMITLGLGFFLSLLNVLFRDVANMVPVATTLLMFLTPVIYPVPNTGTIATLMSLNPLTGLVTASKDMVITGYLSDPIGFIWTTVLSVVFFLFAWRVFHLAEFKMAEVI